MANNIYPEYKEFLLSGAADVSLTQTTANVAPYVLLVDTGTYTYNAAHSFKSDITGIIGPTNGGQIGTPTVANGLFDGADVTFTAVAVAASIEALVIYRQNAGANTTWKLVSYYDSPQSGGLPVTPNGGDIIVQWNASGIFQL